MGETEFEKAYQQLNPEQRQAVDTLEGPVLVVAGPGSGKTQLLALRVVNILEKTEVQPENILCLTFTDAAAENMRARLRRFIGKDAYRVGIFTFHSFGIDLIQNYGEYLPKLSYTEVIDPIENTEILIETLETAEYHNPFRMMRNREYVRLNDIKTTIELLKKGGVTPQDLTRILVQNSQELAQIQAILEPATQISLRKKDGYKEWYPVVKSLQAYQASLPASTGTYYRGITESYVDTLNHILRECEERETSKNKPLSAFKSSYFDSDRKGGKVLKDIRRTENLAYLADIYAQYQQKLQARGLIDFADMILYSLQALHENPVFQGRIHEQYQYCMIDEFQDTNDAQMQMVYALMQDREVQNILAVGDDDQGIFRFQGAEVSNILHFQDHFQDVNIITLKHNYRSHQTILEGARKVIIQGDERLETSIEGIDKTLIASGNIPRGSLELHLAQNVEQEYLWVAQFVQELIDAGHDPNEIAIIAKKHSVLQDCISYLIARDIPIEYEKSQNILAQTHIHQLVVMARYIDSQREDVETRDDLLPAILSFPFWGLSRLEIWQFFEQRQYGVSWLSQMQQSNHPKLQAIAETMIELSVSALTEPAETILYSLIGEPTGGVEGIVTPFKDYYLGVGQVHTNTFEYLSRLHTLQQFLKTIESYQAYTTLLLKDAMRIITLYERGEGIQKEQSFRSGTEAVHCMTAHKSKGLEFQTVIMLNVTQPGWAGKGKPNTVVFPLNLPIQTQKDTMDDHLRLFFVGLTRAKERAVLVGHTVNQKGKDQPPLVFTEFMTPETIDTPDTLSVNQQSWDIATGLSLSESEHRFLESALIHYRMSPSHVNAFLNVEYEGPLAVLEKYILHVPQRSSPDASYGNAFHFIIQSISQQVQAGKDIPSVQELLELGTKRLLKERLTRNDYERMLQKLKDNLPVFLGQKRDEFLRPHQAEYSFKNHNLSIQDIPVTGTIDRIELDQERNLVTIVDFKTSKPQKSWKSSTKQDTLDTYQRQLVMYALFIEHAGLFPGYSIQGKIQFLEPLDGELVDLVMEIDTETKQECLHLMEHVYHHIHTLDFPDISIYQQDTSLGTKKFIQDILSGRI